MNLALRCASGMGTLLCGLLLCATSAQAVLGGAQDTIQVDQIRLRGVHRQHTEWSMTTHEISTGDGSTIKQYVNASGQVFAVSWRTRLKPRLEPLLGASYQVPAADTAALSGVASMKRQQSTRQPHLVLHQSGRMNAFAGLAYIPALVPPGVNADALR